MDCYIGMIMYFAGNYETDGFLPCDGRKLPYKDYAPLYAVIGTQYGGDHNAGVFCLPKMEKVGGTTPMICINGLFPMHV